MAFMIIVVIALLGFNIMALAQLISADKEIEVLKREQKRLEIRLETLIQLREDKTPSQERRQDGRRNQACFR